MMPFGLWPVVLAPLLAAAPPRFEASTSAIYVDVVVSKGERPVEGLSAEDFEVKDDGVVQKVMLVSREEHAVHAVLVLDLSQSLTPQQKQQLRDAASGFLARLEPRDRATLITFTNDLRLVQGPAEPASVRAALGNMGDLGSTAFRDALFAGIAVAPTAPGRAFVVLFSDAKEMCSWLKADRVWDAARHADVTLYHVDPNEAPPETVAMTNREYEAARDSSVVVNQLAGTSAFRELISSTGGRTWNAQFGPELEDSFGKIVNEVQNRYLLLFEPSNPRPGWHSLKVKLKKRRGDVRARRGYFAAP